MTCVASTPAAPPLHPGSPSAKIAPLRRNSRGEHPKDRPLTPQDLHATIYDALGIDPTVQFLNHQGRPVPAIDRGEPIKELI